MRAATRVFKSTTAISSKNSVVAARALRSVAANSAAPVSALLLTAHAQVTVVRRELSTSSAPRTSAAAVTATASSATADAATLSPPARSVARPLRPELPEPKSVEVDGKCVIEYVELAPEGGMTPDTPTVVLIHGAPGTYKDFRYLMPQLQKRARVLGVNLPGFGGSDVIDTDNYYTHISAVPAVQSTLEAVSKICADDAHVFVLGHSFGGHAAVHFAGLNEQQQLVNLKGLFLIASAGFKPHRALQPTTNELMWQMLRSNVAVLERTAKTLTHWIYTKYLRFPDNGPKEYFAAGIVRCATADFGAFRAHIESTRETLPSFLAWAQDDAFMEEQIFLDVSDACHPGPRFAFERGGHNVQKTKADFLAREMTAWMDNVLAGKHTEYSKDVTVLP